MKLKTLFKLLVIVSLLISCNNEEKGSPENVVKIDLSESFDNIQKIKLSTVAKSVEYIPLESDTSFLLDRIYRPRENVLFSENKILIKDNSDELFLFNTSGNFLNKIGGKGRGPGEYPRIQNFTLLSSKLIAVYSASINKVLFYDYESNFIKEIDIDFWPIGLMAKGEDLVFVNTLGRRELTDYFSLTVVSTDGEIKKRLLEKSKEEELSGKVDFALFGFQGRGYILGDSYFYFENSPYEENTLWEVEPDYNLVPKYVFEFGGAGKMPLEEQTQENITDLNKRRKFDSMESFHETTRYIFFRYYSGEKERLHHIYYDKENENFASLRYDKEFGKGLNFAFENDIDGGLAFWPNGQVSDNKVYMLVHGYELEEHIDRQGDDYKAKNEERRNRLVKLAENSRIEDNPILMVVTLKE